MIGKPSASLSSALLARKGQARPAMRPQGFVGLTPAAVHDDLGWNDMGEEGPAPAPVPAAAPSMPAAKPLVLRQRESLDAKLLAAKPAALPKAVDPVATVRAMRAPAGSKAKAAFTLRLNNDRHLRLRLASAVTNRSAQHLVTEALDAFLETLTDVEALARQIDPATKHHG